MATVTGAEYTEVYKFHETGIVELCSEVVALVADGTAERWGLDLDSGEYFKDHYRHVIRFRQKKEDEK